MKIYVAIANHYALSSKIIRMIDRSIYNPDSYCITLHSFIHSSKMKSILCFLPFALSSVYAGPMLMKRDNAYNRYSNATTVVVAPFSNSSSSYSSAEKILDVTPIPGSKLADVTTIVTLTSIIYNTETSDGKKTTVEQLTAVYSTVTSEAAETSVPSEASYQKSNDDTQNSNENTSPNGNSEQSETDEYTTVIQTLTNFVTESYESSADSAPSYSSNTIVPLNSTYIYTTVNSSSSSAGSTASSSVTKDKDVNAYATATNQTADVEATSSLSQDTTLTTKLVSSNSASAGSVTSSSATSTSSGSRTTYTGRGTYYGVGQGNCGWVSKDSQHVVAISQKLYNTLSNKYSFSEYCGRYITASYQGKSVTVEVVDSCGSCSDNDLDFSESAFQELAELEKGVIQVEWYWD